MIPLNEAQSRVVQHVQPLQTDVVALADVVGLVAGDDVSSAVAVPPFDNVAMDGFAVVAADTAGASKNSPVELRVVATVAAGQVAPRPMRAGEAMRVMTGAPLPVGADAAIRVELTESTDQGNVKLLGSVPVGNHVRSAGDDLHEGDLVLRRGTTLWPVHVGLLATVGVDRLVVHRRPVVGVLSTGDELIQPPAPLKSGQIYDSNRPMLLALVAAAGAEAVDLGCLGDDEARIEAAMVAASERCDLVVSSGGVSMGLYDPVKAVLRRLGEMNWMQVAIKPAKPLAAGIINDTAIVGLPGNPVSSAVSFELFARPLIRRLQGHTEIYRRPVSAIADDDFAAHDDQKVHFLRVGVASGADGGRRVRRIGEQGSHQLSVLAAAEGLAISPSGLAVRSGQKLHVLLTGASGSYSSEPMVLH